MSNPSGKNGEPKAFNTMDDRIDEYLMAFGSTAKFFAAYEVRVFRILECLVAFDDPDATIELFNELEDCGIDIPHKYRLATTEAHKNYHFMPCKASENELTEAIVRSFAAHRISMMRSAVGETFARQVNEISTAAQSGIKEARERSLDRFYRDVRKFLESPNKSSRRDIITFDQFMEATSRDYSELAGRENRALRSALKKALVGGKTEIIKNNIRQYGPPSVDGKTYGCDIRLKIGSWGGSDFSKQRSIEAIKSWLALVAPTIIKGMSQFKVTAQLGGKRPAEMPDNSAAIYFTNKNLVVIPDSPELAGAGKALLTQDLISKRAYIYHEMTHILGKINPSIPMGSSGGWAEDCCLNDASMALLADLIRQRGPVVPLDEAIKLLPGVSSPETPSFGVRDSLVNLYAGILYIIDKGTHLYVRETETLSCAVENFANAESMLAAFMTERELFTHALALFYGEYFNETV